MTPLPKQVTVQPLTEQLTLEQQAHKQECLRRAAENFRRMPQPPRKPAQGTEATS